LIANAAAETITLLTLRAPWGHNATHRIQEMHFLLSASFRSFLLMACVGHFSAQRPQPVHLLFAFGIKPP